MRFSLSIDPATGKIVGIAFKSNCCGYGIAGAEILARELSGRSLEELGGLKKAALAEILFSRLQELPRDRVHCGQTAIEALKGVFAEYRRRQLASYDGEDPLICSCFGVSEAAIIEKVSRYGLSSVEEVAQVCRAGLGYGSCRMLIQEIIDELSAP